MSDVALLLGPIVFQDFEIPSGINFGGRQRLAVHRLPGGSRVIDALGRDDAEISFSGIFSGSNATLRARGLDELRVAGVVLPLTWDVFFYTVLIVDFRADYRSGQWIPYNIVCTVLQDEASAFLQHAISLTAAVAADVGIAAGYAIGAGVDLTPLQMVAGSSGATTRGSGAYTATQSSLTDASSAIRASIANADATLAGIDISGAGSAQAGAQRLLAATDVSEQLSSLITAKSYVQRAAVNLTNAST